MGRHDEDEPPVDTSMDGFPDVAVTLFELVASIVLSKLVYTFLELTARTASGLLMQEAHPARRQQVGGQLIRSLS